MPGFRQVMKPLNHEVSATQTAVLSQTGPVGVPSITPKEANGANIVGLALYISATMTQSAAANWTVGSLIKELKISKGSGTLIDITGEDQLEKVFHIYTGLPAGVTFNSGAPTFFSNPTSAGAAGQTSQTETIFIPLHFTTAGVPPSFVLTANGYNAVTNATAGTVSFYMQFFYSSVQVKDDKMKIVTSPTSLNANTDIVISEQFAEDAPIREVWVELANDAALTYETFKIGNVELYHEVDPLGLQIHEVSSPLASHISGFFYSLMKSPTTFPTQASTSTNLPKLIYNFASAQTPTYYLVLA